MTQIAQLKHSAVVPHLSETNSSSLKPFHKKRTFWELTFQQEHQMGCRGGDSAQCELFCLFARVKNELQPTITIYSVCMEHEGVCLGHVSSKKLFLYK